MPKTRVLIVDDSVVVRRLLADCVASDPELEVVGTAPNGKIALTKITHVNPDIVTLDIEMREMDGLATLTAIRKTHPKLPVIVFSTSTERGRGAIVDALALGANDCVTKPANVESVTAAIQRIRDDLVPKIKRLCCKAAETISRPVVRNSAVIRCKSAIDVVAIGVSTGGPNALAEMLPMLAANFPVPVLIVQHMPMLFTRPLADRISTLSTLRAREGEQGARLRPGEAWVAPGGFHMEVEQAEDCVRLRIHDAPRENSCRPAVDVLFRSVAKVFGDSALAVVLTGMGQDGLVGCRWIREAGGQVIVQDEASSVVWGMPGAVSNAGLAEKVLPLRDIAEEINQRVLAGNASRPILKAS